MTKKIVNSSTYGINATMLNHDALYVIKILNKKGFDACIVGGGIRDLLLQKEPKDFDVVTNATPEMVRKIFQRNSLLIGRRFKIVHIIFDGINPDKMINNRPLTFRHIIEVSTYRSSKVHKKHLNEHGKITTDNNYGTQEEDSSRRDFTINSLYYDPIKEIIIDYHDGLKDIKKKIIRIIGDPQTRYIEDPVRILRAIRLSIKLGLSIDKKTAKCFDEVTNLLVHENYSRLYEEMIKILLCGHASKCISKLKSLKLPKNIFPLFDRLFFVKKPDQLSSNIITKTDNRLKETNDVSIIFILAGLLWNTVNDTWQQVILEGGSPRQSLLEAIHIVKPLAYNTGITKNAYQHMSDIWILQYDFENPDIKKIDTLLNHKRFRQSWHLYSSRAEVNQVDLKLFKWWENFIEGDNEVKTDLLLQLKDIYKYIKDSKSKSRIKKITRKFIKKD